LISKEHAKFLDRLQLLEITD